MLLTLLALVLWQRDAYKRAWPPFDLSKALKNSGSFLRLGFFSATMMW
jgi:hypothetical protein